MFLSLLALQTGSRTNLMGRARVQGRFALKHEAYFCGDGSPGGHMPASPCCLLPEFRLPPP